MDRQRDTLAAEAKTLLDADDYDETAQSRVAEIETELEVITDRRDKIANIIRLAQVPGALQPGIPYGPGDANRGPTLSSRDTDEPWQATRGRDPIQVQGSHTEILDRAKRAIEASHVEADAAENTWRHVEAGGRDSTMARYVTAVSDPAYRSAFLKIARDPEHGQMEWTQEEGGAYQTTMLAMRAMSLGSGPVGSYAVPFTLDPSFQITGTGSSNPFRGIARTVQTMTNSWNGVTAGQVSASWDPEASEVSDDSPTLTQPSIPIYTLRLFVPISIEASMDITNIAEEVSILFADARDNAEAVAFATGSGSGQPKGVMTAVGAVTASRVSATTSATYGLVDVYKVANSLAPRHRPNATWAMENTTINLTRQFGITGNYSDFTVDLTSGPPSFLLGKPLVESSAITSTLTSGNDVAIYGNFQRFVIADRAGMTVEFVPHLFSTGNGRPTGQRGWFAYSRTGSDVTDASAFRVLRV
jgi:HK97 family phage major capsid protein